MKSLILKDIYNITHNIRQMAILLIFLAFCFVPSGGANGYIIMCCIMCTMMTVTTFVFDDNAKWEKYAMIMPLTRKDYVGSKYMVSLIFSVAGAVVGFLFACIAGIFLRNLNLLETAVCTVVGLLIAAFFGSLFIVFIFKFGAERARLIMMAAIAIPCVIFASVVKIIESKGVEITNQMIVKGSVLAVVLIILFSILSFHISVKIFENKEF